MVQSIKLKKNRVTAMAVAKILKWSLYWVKTWKLVFIGGE